MHTSMCGWKWRVPGAIEQTSLVSLKPKGGSPWADWYIYHHPLSFSSQVQTTTMCISVSLSGSVVLGCLFAPKVHIILFQPQKNVTSLRVTTNRFSATVSVTASLPSSSYSKGTSIHSICHLVLYLVLETLGKHRHRGNCVNEGYWLDLHHKFEVITIQSRKNRQPDLNATLAITPS